MRSKSFSSFHFQYFLKEKNHVMLIEKGCMKKQKCMKKQTKHWLVGCGNFCYDKQNSHIGFERGGQRGIAIEHFYSYKCW